MYFPDFRGKFFTLDYYIGSGFIINSFYYVEICLFYMHFGKGFYHKWMLSLVKFFSVSIEMCFFFLLLILLITLDDLHMLNHPCELGMNPTRLWCLIFFLCCWIQFANILLKNFAVIYSAKILAYNFLFWWCLFLVLVLGLMVASENVFVSIPSSSVFWKDLRRIDVIFSLYIWFNSPVKPSGPGLVLVGSF